MSCSDLKKLEKAKLVYVRYRDHVLFRGVDSKSFSPIIRECSGWKVRENGEAICVLFDKSVKPFPCEKNSVVETGLILLKNDILEMKEIG